MTPLEAFLERETAAPSWARTAEWAGVPLELRRRAFFSAAVEDARFLSESRAGVEALLRGGRDPATGQLLRRDELITALRALARERGLGDGAGGLTDPASAERAALVVDTNVAMASGYARFRRASTGGALLAFPAMELVRVRRSAEPRDWSARWAAAGGDLFGGRMAARKDSGVWTALSRFGQPYPPFDFGSGMGVRDISRREALALGVIAPGDELEDPVEGFNARLEASVADLPEGAVSALVGLFGGQVEASGGSVRWKGGRRA
jgi:hypothetical protein